MSLTRHVANRRSPIRAFFDKRLPGSQRVAIRANRELRGARRRHGRMVELHLPKVPPFPCRAGADPRLTGTALDLLVRSTLGAAALSDTAATRGAGILTDGPDGRKSALFVERDVVARIRALRPWEAPLDAPACRELALLCVLLARFEQVRRSPPESTAELKRELAGSAARP